MSSVPFYVMLCKEGATIPRRGSPGAAGYDLSSCEEKTVPARSKELIKTGIKMAIPEGYYGRIASRSGLSKKNGIEVGAGVVDSDYRGEVGVILYNHSDKDFEVKVSDSIAQIILTAIITPEITVVSSLDDTERGEGGFGSTDKKGK